jgi:hypothetical protein
MPLRSRAELDAFVDSLQVAAERRAIVAIELSDHVESAIEGLVRRGVSEEDALRIALGNLGEPVELSRRFTCAERCFGPLQLNAWRSGVRLGLAALGAMAALAIVPGEGVLRSAWVQCVLPALLTTFTLVIAWPHGFGARLRLTMGRLTECAADYDRAGAAHHAAALGRFLGVAIGVPVSAALALTAADLDARFRAAFNGGLFATMLLLMILWRASVASRRLAREPR